MQFFPSLVEIDSLPIAGCFYFMGVKSIFFEKGQMYGYLTFIKELGSWRMSPSSKMDRWVQCKCICRKIITVRSSVLFNKSKSSCGCMRYSKSYVKTHGLSHKHPLYGVWKAIKARCYNESVKSYPRYGAVGVKMCELWRNNFKPFYDWAIANGWEKGKHIDKDIIPAKLGISALLYSPEMCTVATRKENANQTSTNLYVMLNNEKTSLHNACEKLGLKYTLIQSRMTRLKYSFEDAINPNLWSVGNKERQLLKSKY